MYKQLKCKSANYQCGNKCQRKSNRCFKSIDIEGAKTLTQLFQIIGRQVGEKGLTKENQETVNKKAQELSPQRKQQLQKEVKETLNTKNIATVESVDISSLPASSFEAAIDATDVFNVNGIPVATTVSPNSVFEEYEYEEAFGTDYANHLKKNEMREIDFSVNSSFSQSDDSSLLMNMSAVRGQYENDNQALSETKKRISKEIKRSINDQLKSLSNGTVISAVIAQGDSKNRARAALYKRAGMTVTNNEIAKGIVKDGKIVSLEKYNE